MLGDVQVAKLLHIDVRQARTFITDVQACFSWSPPDGRQIAWMVAHMPGTHSGPRDVAREIKIYWHERAEQQRRNTEQAAERHQRHVVEAAAQQRRSVKRVSAFARRKIQNPGAIPCSGGRTIKGASEFEKRNGDWTSD